MNALQFAAQLCKTPSQTQQQRDAAEDKLNRKLHENLGHIVASLGSQSEDRHIIQNQQVLPPPSELLDFFL